MTSISIFGAGTMATGIVAITAVTRQRMSRPVRACGREQSSRNKYHTGLLIGCRGQ